MKRPFYLLIVFLSFSVPLTYAGPPQKVKVVPERVFIPPGFDDNDTIQIFIEGRYKNARYKKGKYEVKVLKKDGVVFIRDYARVYKTGPAPDVKVYYSKTIELDDVLPTGKYKVFFERQDGNRVFKGTLVVKEAKNKESADDHFYAPVTKVFIKGPPTEVPHVLVVRVKFPNECFKIKELRIEPPQNRVISVLPIADRIQKEGCEEKGELVRQVSKPLLHYKPGRHLIHVRSLQGGAFNEPVNLLPIK